MEVSDIIFNATTMGACNKISSVKDWESLVDLFFSPQGIEFCLRHNYPSLSILEKISTDVEQFGVYINAQTISLNNPNNIAVVGHTEARIDFCDPNVCHKVIAMHGAKLYIDVRNYAVVKIISIGDNDIHVKKDDTSIILQ